MPSTVNNKNSDLELSVTIRDRRKVLFQGSVFSITSFNDVGEFAVLPLHANFISLVEKSVIVDKGTPAEQTFEIERGLISVDELGVSVYVGI